MVRTCLRPSRSRSDVRGAGGPRARSRPIEENRQRRRPRVTPSWPTGRGERALDRLKNIGPVTVRQLGEVGIGSEQQLREVGALEAYRRLRRAFPERINLMCLYALQGALLDCHWGELPPEVRDQLRRMAGAP